MAGRVRPANRDIPRNPDGTLPTQWLLVEWPKGSDEPTDYWLSTQKPLRRPDAVRRTPRATTPCSPSSPAHATHAARPQNHPNPHQPNKAPLGARGYVSAAALSFADMARVEMEWLRAYVGAGLATSILPRTVKRVVCTAVSRDSEVVAPDGRIYSCTEQPLVPGDERHSVADLGLLPAGELRPAGAFDDWHDTLDAGGTGCHTCKILPVCGGACPKLWREGSPPCPTLRVTVEDRLDLYATLSGLVPA